jgi:DNA-binding XRE family transcriptional regulator
MAHLAKEGGTAKNTVIRAENERDIRPSSARKIAAALEVKVADLVREPN